MKKLLIITTILLLYTIATAQQKDKSSQNILYSNFINPPNTAKPRVWWHWMNGNITKEGIAKDLQWMKRSGIGGVQNFDAHLASALPSCLSVSRRTPRARRRLPVYIINQLTIN